MDPTERSDQELIELVRLGDEVAFSELVRRTARLCHRVAARLAGTEADRLVRAAYGAARAALPATLPSAVLAPWILGHLARTLPPGLAPEPGPSPEERAFGALGFDERRLLALAIDSHLSYGDIAAIVGLSTDEVRQELARARSAFLEQASRAEGARAPRPLSGVHPEDPDRFAYRDGELTAEHRSVVEAHVRSCTACMERVEALSALEGSLRQAIEDPDEDYLRSLASNGHSSSEPGDPVAAVATTSSPDEDRRSGFHWLAVASSASAGVGVIVLVFVLIRSLGLVEPSRSPPPERGALDASLDRSTAPVLAPVPTQTTPEPAAPPPSDPIRPGAGPQSSPGAPMRPDAAQMPPAPPEGGRSLATQEEPRAAVPVPVARPPATPPATPARSRSPEETAFVRFVRARGLPRLYGPDRVSASELLAAEPELRELYRSGEAGADSARIRLYLAEAARLRYARISDEETANEIVHHYRRALRLAHDDPPAARVASERLQDFLESALGSAAPR